MTTRWMKPGNFNDIISTYNELNVVSFPMRKSHNIKHYIWRLKLWIKCGVINFSEHGKIFYIAAISPLIPEVSILGCLTTLRDRLPKPELFTQPPNAYSDSESLTVGAMGCQPLFYPKGLPTDYYDTIYSLKYTNNFVVLRFWSIGSYWIHMICLLIFSGMSSLAVEKLYDCCMRGRCEIDNESP